MLYISHYVDEELQDVQFILACLNDDILSWKQMPDKVYQICYPQKKKEDINVLDHFIAGIFQESVQVNSAAFAAQRDSSLIFW